MTAKAKVIYSRLKRVKDLSEKERLMFATTLAETPDERWARNRTYLRLMESSADYGKRKSGS
ncbi:MAG TPA: hypothetical protein DCY13_05510 [Verrucomicrobiales bacterium]|nr:hypothetical protein [Verrucomicrobiales bacterium]